MDLLTQPATIALDSVEFHGVPDCVNENHPGSFVTNEVVNDLSLGYWGLHTINIGTAEKSATVFQGLFWCVEPLSRWHGSCYSNCCAVSTTAARNSFIHL